MRQRLLALGDSISCGEGVGVRVHRPHTWVGLLAHAIDADLDLLAARGANTREVRESQLPEALSRPTPLATVMVGLNDVIKGQPFDPAAIREDLFAVIAELLAVHTTIVLARWHDPTRLVPMPSRVRARLLQRIEVINAAVDSARGHGVLVLDLDNVSVLRTRGGWAVDRLHPGFAGHRAIAAAAAELLISNGIYVRNPIEAPGTLYPHTRLAEARWLARHGAPYLAKNFGRIDIPIAKARSASH